MKQCFCYAARGAIIAAVLLFAPRARSQMLDLNGNGMSDVWEQAYFADGLAPDADADNDGVSNRQESLAGTDPLDPQSKPRIASLSLSGTNVLVTIAAELGKRYELQSVDALGSNWVAGASAVVRSGATLTLSAPASPQPRFFRIGIGDVDSDGDGLSDWEEYRLGLDPLNPTSSGRLDINGAPMSDYAFATANLPSQNLVTISASDPAANQPDAGQSAINLGSFTVSRAGFPLNQITVNLDLGPPGSGVATEGVDYAPLPRTVVLPVGVSSYHIPVTPLANTNRATPALVTLQVLAGAHYRLGNPTNAGVLLYPSATPAGTGLTGQYFTNSSATWSSSLNFNPANLKLTRLDTNINFTWGTTTDPIPNNGYYCVRWTGLVQPQYSETYYFVANTDDGVKVWVNDQLIIDSWITRSAADSIGAIALQGGVRYKIKMEYFQATGSAVARLSWYSPSQPKQIIPTSRLYPDASAPAAVTAPLTAVGFLGQPFSFTVTGANSPTAYSATGVPPGLNFDTATGLLSGTPLLVGNFQITLTASNALGLGASVLQLAVVDTGSAVSREVWTNVPGVFMSNIPVNDPPASVTSWGGLEGVTDFGDNYAERIRGYFTAPATGNYYFWIAGSDSAELWISNDREPANKVRRAYVSPSPNPTSPPINGTGIRQWQTQSNQKSPWLALIAGEQYYFEVLHKAGVGTNDHWSVGWLQDPTGTNGTPAGVTPAYLLGRYFPVPPVYQPGTLYAATMLPQSGSASSGVGSATLRVSADGARGYLKFSSSGLTSAVTGQHIHSDAYLNNPSQIIFDIDTAQPQPDGTYIWDIVPRGTLSADDIREILREGKAYINLHTSRYPGGEINGHFTLVSGTRSFTPPPPAPAWTDDHSDPNAAARFLIQATFGPAPADIASVQALGYDGWINSQFALPPTYHLPYVLANISYDPTTRYPSASTFNSWWQQSVAAPDQLRQRVAFALSEIMVVSEAGILQNNARALSDYYDMLLDNAFGNFRDLLKAVSLHPAMGLYLDMRGNDKGDITTGRHANENFAREVLQLFSIGLNRMWPDGSLVLSSDDSLVPTYNQDVIMGFASVFTGWNYYQPNQANGRLPTSWSVSANYTNAMVLVPSHHELGAKRLLDNVVLPQAWGDQASSASTNFDLYCSNDLELAHDSIFNNQNVGPFICRQLIQRLVTSHPSRDYLYRVVQAFNDNGAGVRGDLQAVIKAILLDYEARSAAARGQLTFGKQREPVLRVAAAARAFPAPPSFGGTYSQAGARAITCSMTNAHRLNTGDTVQLGFADTSGQPAPAATRYSVTVTSPTAFTVNDPALLTGAYVLTPNATVTNMLGGNTVTTNIISVNISGYDLPLGAPVYLLFPTGAATNGEYQVFTATNNNWFVAATALSVASTGTVWMPRFTGGYIQSATNLTVSCSLNHGLLAGDDVFVNFLSGTAPDGRYTVASVVDDLQFRIVTTNSASQTQNNLRVFPMFSPRMTRSGNVGAWQNTWNMGNTDGSLTQTPLRSPTVFNFFFPDYRFPGALAAAGLTTPEFQLTSDTETALQMNFLAGGILNNTANTNGLSSFTSGDGDIALDIGPWMTTGYTATTNGVSSLVDALNTLLAGGNLGSLAKNQIVNYVSAAANFPYGSPPTSAQIRDRVRAVVHLILVSPECTIQK